MHKKTIAIGVPCFNEEKAIPEFLNKFLNNPSITPLLANYEFVFIFVNDGSTDGTYNILVNYSKSRKDFYYVSFDRNYGKEAGLVAIYNAALKLNVDALIKMDVDLQDPPYLIPKFIFEWEQGYQYVFGHSSGRKGQNWAKKLFSSAYYRVYHWVTGENEMKDGDRDFALLDKPTIAIFSEIHGPDRFDRSIASHYKLKSKRIDYEYVNRADGTTRWSFKKLFKYSMSSFKQFGAWPLFLIRQSMMISGIAMIIMMILFIVFRNGDYMPYLISMVCLIVLFLGIICLYAYEKKHIEKRKIIHDHKYKMYTIEKTNIPNLKTETGESM